MSDFKWFKDTVTGKTGKYPAHFQSKPNFEVISSNEAPCVDCGLDEPVVEEVEVPDLPAEVEDRPTYNTIMERFKKHG